MIQLVNNTDLKTDFHITRDTISEIYPKYYARGVVEFFLKHHNQDNILEDIQNARVWQLETERVRRNSDNAGQSHF